LFVAADPEYDPAEREHAERVLKTSAADQSETAAQIDPMLLVPEHIASRVRSTHDFAPDFEHEALMNASFEVRAGLTSPAEPVAALGSSGDSGINVAEPEPERHVASQRVRAMSCMHGWLHSLNAIVRMSLFVDDPRYQRCLDKTASLLVFESEDPGGSGQVRKYQWIAWDSADDLVGRKSSVVGGKLNFCPKPLTDRTPTYVKISSEDLTAGSVSILVPDARVQMIRRSGQFRPTVPWEARLFEHFSKFYDALECGDAEFLAGYSYSCAACGSSSPLATEGFRV
jgi:hypothetical protein